MKKTFYKITAFVFLLNISVFAFFAQNTEEIALPDVTTVISGDEVSAGKDALPDFSKVLPDENTAKGSMVQLPDASVAEDDSLATLPANPAGVKDVFAEGQIGGGYPGFFTGNFSIYRSAGENPFLLRFMHETATGYAGKSAADGFFDNQTEVSGNKTFTLPSSVWKFSGSYNKSGDGMQNVSSAFYDMTKQTLDGTADFSVKPSDIFSLNVSLNPSWYSRYAGGKSTSAAFTDPEETASMFSLHPSIKALWTLNQVEIAALGTYLQQDNVAGNANITGTGDFDAQATHRGSFGAEISWSNSVFTVFEKASAVTGTALGKNNSVIVPFTVGLKIEGQPDFMSRSIVFSAEGGLDSQQQTYADLEKKYRFAILNFIPSETSDWYARSQISLPLYQVCTLSCTAEYRKTAFENGVWQPNYSSSLSSGVYGFVQSELETFKTETELSFHAGLLTAAASWTAQWKDIPVLECAHKIKFSAALQNAAARYGADASIAFEAGTDSDSTPVVGFGTFVRLTPSVRIAAEADDIVKLVTGKEREYAGKYSARSGSVALLVKFFF